MPRDRFGTDKDVEDLARRARKAGWTVSVDGSTHLRWQAPEGGEFRSPLTGGLSTARRVRRNLVRLDRAGFGAPEEPPPPAPLAVEISAEVHGAVEQLQETVRALEALASAGDADGAAELVRHSRNVLRDFEEALRARSRAARSAAPPPPASA